MVSFAAPKELSAQAGKQGYVDIQFQVISWDRTIRHLWFSDGGKKESILALPHIRSPQYHYKGPADLIFYGDEVNAGGLPVPLAHAKIPNSSRRFLLLIKPDEKVAGHYQVIVMSDDKTDFPPGSFKIINASRFDVACEMNREAFVLEPSASKLYKPKFDNDDKAIGVRAAFRYADEPWKRGYGSRWGYNEKVRTLAFVFELQQEGQEPIIRIKQIRESVKS